MGMFLGETKNIYLETSFGLVFLFSLDGFKFYRSSNNVILCPGNEQGFLPPEYFERVVQTRPSKYIQTRYLPTTV